MDNTPVAQRDADYRRGTVLGLTVAEVFILLLFLLLLALLVLVREWEVEREAETARRVQMEDRLAAMQKQHEEWQAVIREFKAPEEIVTLRQQKEEAERKAEKHRKQAEILRKILGQSDQAEARLAAERQLEATRQELEDTKRQLHLLHTKGENPPCWYEIVQDDKRPKREKPLYALDVAVSDTHMIVHRPEPPSGGATDDGDSTYAEEAARLPFDAIPYGRPLSDAEIVRHLQPISTAGKDKQVRTYACIFWLRVWDKTSPDAKERWKQAHDGILEGMFGAYTVQNDPWPGS